MIEIEATEARREPRVGYLSDPGPRQLVGQLRTEPDYLDSGSEPFSIHFSER